MNESEPTPTNAKDTQIVRLAFDRHGYGFQYAVLRECRQLAADRKSVFNIDGVEYPVQLNGHDLHVDFLLRSENALLVVESKRVDPAYGTWCFARSAHVSGGSLERKRVVLETVLREDEPRITVHRTEAEISERQYHVGQEIKDNDVKGNSVGKGLDLALTQAMRAAAGVIVAASERPELLGKRFTKIVPVIVTTARILACDTDLAESDLATGQLPENIVISEQPWVWYRSMASASMRHNLPWYQDANRTRIGYSFSHLQDYAYARSVAVVNVAGLPRFLNDVKFHTGDF